MPTITIIKLCIAGLAVILSAGSSAYFIHQYDGAKLARVQAGYATAQLAADQASQKYVQAIVARGDAISGAYATQRIQIETQTITNIKEVTRYVHETTVVGCITLGFVRVLDAAVLGVTPASLPLTPGSTDDTCSPLKAADLAGAIIENYGVARSNAAQLDALSHYR